MTQTALTITEFSKALGIARVQVQRHAKDPAAGFLYAPIGEEPIASATGRHRKFYAPWQVQLITSVRAQRVDLATARQIFDDLLLTTTQPPTSAEPFELPKGGRAAS